MNIISKRPAAPTKPEKRTLHWQMARAEKEVAASSVGLQAAAVALPKNTFRFPRRDRRMALSKVMASSTSANSDQARQPSSLYSVTAAADFHNSPVSSSSCAIDPTKTTFGGSMSMDDILRNIYAADPAHPPDAAAPPPPPPHQADAAAACRNLPAGRTVDEVWKEISSAHSAAPADRGRAAEGLGFKEAGTFEEMTLEDFLAKAGAVREEDVRVPAGQQQQPPPQPAEGFGMDAVLGSRFPPQQQVVEGSSVLGFGNGVEGGGVGGGRGKRRAVQEPVDRVAQQRQRRMIKNRESAARSRERKQAYTVELESLVMQLEEENARLQRQQAEQTKKRLQEPPCKSKGKAVHMDAPPQTLQFAGALLIQDDPNMLELCGLCMTSKAWVSWCMKDFGVVL
ncbi:hypothetical protein ACLOJK_030237 [Asimina triloba]